MLVTKVTDHLGMEHSQRTIVAFQVICTWNKFGNIARLQISSFILTKIHEFSKTDVFVQVAFNLPSHTENESSTCKGKKKRICLSAKMNIL